MQDNKMVFDAESTPEYEEFVEKFKPKKTTDDCYTPPLVYDAVKKWACDKYGIDQNKIVRPFYPGGDYEHYDYPVGCTVLDNPPFSILAQICKYYLDNGIAFFLFAPSLTAFSGRNVAMRMNHIICDADIVYENGAIVRTAFVTSYGSHIMAQTAPDLGEVIKGAVSETLKATKKELPKYRYPHEVLTAAALQKYAHYGVDFEVRRDECMLISRLDAQKDSKKSIYGGGLLLNDEATKRHKSCGGKSCGGKSCGGKSCGGKSCGSRVAAVGTRKTNGKKFINHRKEWQHGHGKIPAMAGT